MIPRLGESPGAWGQASGDFVCQSGSQPSWYRVGWRGYLQPRLQKRYGALAASLVVGGVWALYHLPQWFIPAMGQAEKWPFLVFTLYCIALAVWLDDPSSVRFILIGLGVPIIAVQFVYWLSRCPRCGYGFFARGKSRAAFLARGQSCRHCGLSLSAYKERAGS